MNKQEIFDLIASKNIWHEVTEHGAVFNMAELEKVDLPYNGCDAKNLFVRDDKKQNYYLISIKGDKKINLKDFHRQNNTRNLSFASPEELDKYLGLAPGAVSPFGLLNDNEKVVIFYLDSAYKDDDIIGIHPNDNAATVWLKTKDLIKTLEENGHQVKRFEI